MGAGTSARVLLPLMVGCVVFSSCYEIRPRLPEDYAGSAPDGEGWPPLAVYHEDPFHVANRFFQRLWILRSEAPTGDEPVARRADLDDVDEREILMLLQEIRGGLTGADEDSLSGRGRRLLEADLGLLARLWHDDRRERERRIATMANEIVTVLRATEGRPELAKSPATELPERHAHPVGSELEAWSLDAGTGRAIVVQLRRERWRETGSPDAWRTCDDDDVITFRPAGSGEIATGTLREVCDGCHVAR